VLPATAQSYGDARDIVNGPAQIRRDATCSVVEMWQQFLDALHAGQAFRRVCRELDLTFKGAET
jgi:hypothetical protein